MFRASKKGLHLLLKLQHSLRITRKPGFQFVDPRNRFRSALAQSLHLLLNLQAALGLLRKPGFQAFRPDGSGIDALAKGLHYGARRSI
jgi:hypothetical protein